MENREKIKSLKNTLKQLITCCMLLTTVYLNGQDYKIYTASKESNAIQIKWLSKNSSLQAEFDIYRKTNEAGEWQKINSEPIRRAKPLSESELELLPENENNYALAQYSSAFLDETKEFQNNFNYLLFSAIADNKLAEYCGIYFVDKTIDISKTYTYKLKMAGTSNDLATSAPLKYGSDQTNSPISNFQAKPGNLEINFNWDYQEKFQLYKVYRNNNSQLFFIPTLEDIQAAKSSKFPYRDKDSTLVLGQSYSYQIVGVDYFGRETTKSNTAIAEFKNLTPPPAAQGLRVEYKQEKYFHITWREVDKRFVTQTHLYKSQTKNGNYEKIYSGNDLVYDDKNIKDESDYYYVLEVVNKHGIGANTDTVRANVPDLTPPSTPKNMKALTDTGYIKLTWDANIEKDLQGYFVFRALKGDEGNFTPLFPTPIKENSFEDRHAVEVQNNIVYKICAVDIHSNRSKLTEPIFVRMPDVTPPSQPVIRELDYAEGVVSISWVGSNEPDFKQFEIIRGTRTNDSTFGNFTTIGNTSSTNYRDNSAQPNSAYQYHIQAMDSSNNKSKSEGKMISTLSFKLPEAIEKWAIRKAEQSVFLSWSNPKKQEVQIFRKTDLGSFIPITQKFSGETMEDKEVSQGSTYIYKLIAEGAGEESWESQELKVEF